MVAPIGIVTIVVVSLLAWLLRSMTFATPARMDMGLAPRGSGAPGPQPARG